MWKFWQTISNLFRYTERISTLEIVLRPTGKRDDLNIQAALDYLAVGGALSGIDTDALVGVNLDYRYRSRWRFPWQKKQIVDVWGGGTIHLLEGIYDIKTGMKLNRVLPPIEVQLRGAGYEVTSLGMSDEGGKYGYLRS